MCQLPSVTALDEDQAIEFGRARLRVTWDNRPGPSIDAPIALFYGAGTLYNRDAREYLVKGFPIHVRFSEKESRLACYFPMPFFHSARFELIGAGNPVSQVRWSVRTAPYRGPANHAGYFHATFRDFPTPEPGKDLVNTTRNRSEKLGTLYHLCGKERTDCRGAVAGDLLAAVKLRETHTGDTLAEKARPVKLAPPDFPLPVAFECIRARNKGDEEKMAVGLMRLHEEDPTLSRHYEESTKESLTGIKGAESTITKS